MPKISPLQMRKRLGKKVLLRVLKVSSRKPKKTSRLG